MNELLPFGEYVPPERLAATAPHVMVGLDAWELEHLLHRLAAANTMGGVSARRDRRRHRSHAHASTSVQERHSVGAPAPSVHALSARIRCLTSEISKVSSLHRHVGSIRGIWSSPLESDRHSTTWSLEL